MDQVDRTPSWIQWTSVGNSIIRTKWDTKRRRKRDTRREVMEREREREREREIDAFLDMFRCFTINQSNGVHRFEGSIYTDKP